MKICLMEAPNFDIFISLCPRRAGSLSVQERGGMPMPTIPMANNILDLQLDGNEEGRRSIAKHQTEITQGFQLERCAFPPFETGAVSG